MDNVMDGDTFLEAFRSQTPEPNLDALVRRFHWALHHSGGDEGAAMAAVNEVLAVPVSYQAFCDRMGRAA